VEFGNLEKGVPPWFLVIWKKKRCRREVWWCLLQGVAAVKICHVAGSSNKHEWPKWRFEKDGAAVNYGRRKEIFWREKVGQSSARIHPFGPEAATRLTVSAYASAVVLNARGTIQAILAPIINCPVIF
jgi:hypothetical protein